MVEEEEEFVPEPGTIALLGSGLLGLAGYAGLRRRA
ncbi:MAG TPA: PEP-CTERM sorting domain-containing protein [Chloroflexi bacterium]|nr:PEP-CTERM sorting domain-containing protein [Chloroflexota bacterium]